MQKFSPILFVIILLFNSCNTARKTADADISLQPGFEQFYIVEQQTEIAEVQKNKLVSTQGNKAEISLENTGKTNFFARPEEEIASSAKEKNNVVKRPKTEKRSAISAMEAPAETNSDNLFLLCTALTGIGLGLFFSPLMPAHSKKLSFYALNNRRKAVYIIAASHIAIGFLALFLGRNLAELGIRTTELCTNVLSGLACASAIIYPVRKVKRGFFKPGYLKQKMATLLVLLSGFALLTNIGINTKLNPEYSPATAYIYHGYDKCFNIQEDNNIANVTSAAKSNGDGGQIALTILLFLVCAMLLALVIGLACAFACSDMGAVAALIAIGGLALTIFLFVSGWRRIWR